MILTHVTSCRIYLFCLGLAKNISLSFLAFMLSPLACADSFDDRQLPLYFSEHLYDRYDDQGAVSFNALKAIHVVFNEFENARVDPQQYYVVHVQKVGGKYVVTFHVPYDRILAGIPTRYYVDSENYELVDIKHGQN